MARHAAFTMQPPPESPPLTPSSAASQAESPEEATQPKGRLTFAFLLLLIALGLRLVGIDQGLPHHGEPDPYIVRQASSLITNGVTDRKFAGWKYPHLTATVLALTAPEPVKRLAPGATLAEHHELATRIRQRGRVVVAVIASFAAPITYLIAARFLAGRFAFLAGLLVASSVLHICFSVQARPHAVVSTFATLAILSAIRWREKPSLWRAALLGLSVAASISSLHSGAAALAPAGAALLGLLRGGVPKVKVLVGTLIAATIIAVSAGWFYIRAEDGHGMDPTRTAPALNKRSGGLGDKELDKVVEKEMTKASNFKGERWIEFSGHLVSLTRFNGDGFGVAFDTLRVYDPVILFFSALGLLGMAALALRRRPAGGDKNRTGSSAVWITVAYGIPTFLVFGVYQLSPSRSFLSLTPVTCILAAYGTHWLCDRRVLGVFSKALVAAGVGSMLVAAVLIARLRVIPDTYELAAQAVEELEGDAEPLVYMVELDGLPIMAKPKFLQKDAAWARGPWDHYQWAVLNPKHMRLPGEPEEPDLTGAAPRKEAALRLGHRIMPTSMAARVGVYYGEDRAAAAEAALAKVDADIVLINTSKGLGSWKLEPHIIRDAWKEGVRADGRWRIERTIRNSKLDDRNPLGYKLSFIGAFTQQARGPEIEVWTRR